MSRLNIISDYPEGHSHDVRLNYSENEALDILTAEIEDRLYEELRSAVIDEGGTTAERMTLSIMYQDNSLFSILVKSRMAIWDDFTFLSVTYTDVDEVEKVVLDTILSELS